jgi:hypothetical protein
MDIDPIDRPRPCPSLTASVLRRRASGSAPSAAPMRRQPRLQLLIRDRAGPARQAVIKTTPYRRAVRAISTEHGSTGPGAELRSAPRHWSVASVTAVHAPPHPDAQEALRLNHTNEPLDRDPLAVLAGRLPLGRCGHRCHPHTGVGKRTPGSGPGPAPGVPQVCPGGARTHMRRRAPGVGAIDALRARVLWKNTLPFFREPVVVRAGDAGPNLSSVSMSPGGDAAGA